MATQLAEMDEPPLQEVGREPVVRLLWHRSFDGDVVVRVALGQAPELVAVWGTKPDNRNAKLLTQEEASSLRTALAVAEIGSLTYSDGVTGADGSTWFLEVRVEERHHVIQRWSLWARREEPALVKLAHLCEKLLSLSGLDTEPMY